MFRIRVGNEINSAALIADGYHARTDGLTSIAAVFGALGVWLGFPLADPLVGLLITIAIFGIVWQSARSVLTRMLDGVEPGVIDEIHHAAEHIPGITVVEAKARWIEGACRRRTIHGAAVASGCGLAARPGRASLRMSLPHVRSRACGCVDYGTQTLTRAWRDAAASRPGLPWPSEVPTESEPPAFVLQTPKPDSQLARAGVLGGELVLAVDGQQVRDFWEVQVAIRKHSLGDEVGLLIQRGSETRRELKCEHVSEYPKT
jgi:Cation efflux family/PDZ domain